MIKFSERLACTKETKDLIMNDCVKEFIKNNPELDGVYVTHEMILKRIAKYYLGKI